MLVIACMSIWIRRSSSCFARATACNIRAEISWCTSKAKAATLSEWSHAFEKLYTEQWISSTARIVRGDIVCDRRECGARTLQFSWRCWGHTLAEASNYCKLELLRQVRRSAPSASSSEKILFTVSWSCISQAACTLVLVHTMWHIGTVISRFFVASRFQCTR